MRQTSAALACSLKSRFKHAEHDIPGVKARALQAAAYILATRGVEDLTLRAIAEHGGIGIASIYHYFDGKEAILLSLSLVGFADLRREMLREQADPRHESPMRGGARGFFAFAERHPKLFSLMFNERMLARHAELRAAEQRAFEVYEDAVRGDVRIPPAHKEDAAYALWALGRGMAAITASFPTGRLPSELHDKLYKGATFLTYHEVSPESATVPAPATLPFRKRSPRSARPVAANSGSGKGHEVPIVDPKRAAG